jgi:hypothetical protein
MKTSAFRRALAMSLLGGVVFAGGWLAGCEAKVSDSTYSMIQPGMTLDDVERIMESKGERQEVSGTSISGAGIGSTSSSGPEVWVWKAGRKEVSVTMAGGKVVSVSKAGF